MYYNQCTGLLVERKYFLFVRLFVFCFFQWQTLVLIHEKQGDTLGHAALQKSLSFTTALSFTFFERNIFFSLWSNSPILRSHKVCTRARWWHTSATPGLGFIAHMGPLFVDLNVIFTCCKFGYIEPPDYPIMFKKIARFGLNYNLSPIFSVITRSLHI